MWRVANRWQLNKASDQKSSSSRVIDVGEFPYFARRTHCREALWGRTQFLLFGAAHPRVFICAIKKLNRNQPAFLHIYCCGSCDVKEEKMKVSQNSSALFSDAVSAEMPRKNYLLCMYREHVRCSNKTAAQK